MAQIKLNATYGMTGTLPAVSGANLTNLDATDLSGNLPALNASSLTNLDARDLENALPAISGASLTGISTGKVLQVVQAVKTAETDLAYRSFTSISGLGVTITPAATSSKVLVLVDLNSIGTHSNMTTASLQILRSISGGADTAVYVMSHNSMDRTNYDSTTGNTFGQVEKAIYLDSPSTTSAVTYHVQMMTNTSAGYWRLNNNSGTNDVSSSITAMEIGA